MSAKGIVTRDRRATSQVLSAISARLPLALSAVAGTILFIVAFILLLVADCGEDQMYSFVTKPPDEIVITKSLPEPNQEPAEQAGQDAGADASSSPEPEVRSLQVWVKEDLKGKKLNPFLTGFSAEKGTSLTGDFGKLDLKVVSEPPDSVPRVGDATPLTLWLTWQPTDAGMKLGTYQGQIVAVDDKKEYLVREVKIVLQQKAPAKEEKDEASPTPTPSPAPAPSPETGG